MKPDFTLTRRGLFKAGAAALAGTALAQRAPQAPTEFQIACMTLNYSGYSFERALKGIASAGYKYVAWGVTHRDESGREYPVIAEDAPASRAGELGKLTRDLGLEPVMMFAVKYPEEPDGVQVYKQRIAQAAAAKIPYILSFGDIYGGADKYPAWISHLKELAPIARDAGVTIAIKQHWGNTATGQRCAQIVGEIHHESVRMFYDAGNTFWYSNVDPLTDIPTCANFIRGFAIKDFRAFPKRAICGPGMGEIDHYKLFSHVARTGLKMPLACENIFEPYVPRPSNPEGVDALARRSREYLEAVTRGLLV
jgi:sugar phosphate isomerase/epimerase